jgi:hypothetical protein
MQRKRMVASLGHDLRHQARKGDAKAFVVSRHRDGSFKLVQSRVLTAGGLGAAAIGFMTATMAGLRGAGAVFRRSQDGDAHTSDNRMCGRPIGGSRRFSIRWVSTPRSC